MGTSGTNRKHICNVGGLGDARREQYSTLILLAAASGLRSSELLALKINDIDVKASTVRVDESSDQRKNGNIGRCKKRCGLPDGCAA
jgi:integrase